jgi:hypothetical protein
MIVINDSKISKLTGLIMWCDLVRGMSLNYRLSRVEFNTTTCRAVQLNSGTGSAKGSVQRDPEGVCRLKCLNKVCACVRARARARMCV